MVEAGCSPRLAGLRELGAKEFQDLVTLFFEEGATRVAGLRATGENGDTGSLARVAHNLKGSSSTFGAAGLPDLCAQLESATSSGDRAEVPRLIDEVGAEFDRVRAALTEEPQ